MLSRRLSVAISFEVIARIPQPLSWLVLMVVAMGMSACQHESTEMQTDYRAATAKSGPSFVEIAQEAGTAVILDADQPSPSAERLLEKVHFPVVSETVARALGGDGTVEGGLKALESRGAMFAVATRGARGALAWPPPGAPQ